MNNKTILSVIAIMLMTALIFSCGKEQARYSLTVDTASDGNGTGTISKSSKSSGSYLSGTTITLKAVPGKGSFFFGWYDAAEGGRLLSRKAKYRFKLTGESEIYARFENEVITFADPILEKAVRRKVEIFKGDLTYKEVSKIKKLEASNTSFGKLTLLDGIEYLTALQNLELIENEISDLSPLTNLTDLRSLVFGRNEKLSDLSPLTNLTKLNRLLLAFNGALSDISPLSKLTKLTELRLDNCTITDISALANMTELNELRLSKNRLTDITPLSTLKELNFLTLDNNEISNISPLTNLIKLKFLMLDNNRINDIKPLIQNRGIADIDLLTIDGNEIPDSQIRELKALVKSDIFSSISD